MVIFLLPIFLTGCGYSKDFDKGTIPNVVPEAVLNGVVVLENVSKSACKSNGRVVTMWLVKNHSHFNTISTRNSQNCTKMCLIAHPKWTTPSLQLSCFGTDLSLFKDLEPLPTADSYSFTKAIKYSK